ncbi:MAG TPA: porin [Verrucomicrobiae bacterium]|nr:porin [Verrucomicrobiae bacterium]
MSIQRLLVTTAILGLPLTVFPVRALAQSSPVSNEALLKRIDELEQKIKVLERKQELSDEAAGERAKAAPLVSAGSGGFVIQSADTNFVLKVRAHVQADGRYYPGDHAAGTANDTFLMRRVRPILEGSLYQKFDYRLMLDFGSGLNASAQNIGFVQEAYLNAKLWPQFQIQAGKFKEPVGLERMQTDANLMFTERGYPTQLVPNRDVGIQLQGDLLDGTLSYAAGVFNGTTDGGSDDVEIADDDKDVAGRLFARPFKNTDIVALQNLGIGVGGTYGNQEGSVSKYVSPGQQQFFSYRSGSGAGVPNVVSDGAHWRVTPQGYYYYGPFGLFGEYVISNTRVRQAGGGAGAGSFASLQNTAWQVAGSYFITGEDNGWIPSSPRKPLNFNGEGWGALELVARFGQLDLDKDTFPIYASAATSAQQAASWGVGLNWYLNKNIKTSLDYEQSDFKGGDSNPLASNGEKVILTRFQFIF